MKLKDIHKTAGQYVQNLAIANAENWAKNKPRHDYARQYKSKSDECLLICSFYFNSTSEGDFFWDDVEKGAPESYLRKDYTEIFENEPKQNIA